MPFPFVEQYYGTEYLKEFINSDIVKTPRSSDFWTDNVLCELPKEKGYKIISNVSGYGYFYRFSK